MWEELVLYGLGIAALGYVFRREYRKRKHGTNDRIMNEIISLAYVTWVWVVPIVHAMALVKQASNARMAWASSHTICSVDKHRTALGNHVDTKNFCVDASGHDRFIMGIWFDFLWSRLPFALWTGSTYDEMMTSMETASIQKMGVRWVAPVALVVLVGVYVVQKLGLETVNKLMGRTVNNVPGVEVVDRGDRLCLKGLAGGEVCVHKNPPPKVASSA